MRRRESGPVRVATPSAQALFFCARESYRNKSCSLSVVPTDAVALNIARRVAGPAIT